MKICVAQTRPVKGDIQSNIEMHKKLIDMAANRGADSIVFPELSLTGYEPRLAKGLATHQDDSRFDDFQKIADARQITIGVGVPTQYKARICISMVIFQPHKARQIYSKQYLHTDEEPFFICGPGVTGLIGDRANMALAICYELSIPEHAEKAFRNGAEFYIASVAKSASGVEQAAKRLGEIARTYSMTVFMSNCIGPSDDFESAGKSAVWNNKGLLVGQLNDTNEGVLIFDTETQELIEIAILPSIQETPTRRIPGNEAGKVVIKANFDDPLPEFDV
jgi:predicted amidohydrolase